MNYTVTARLSILDSPVRTLLIINHTIRRLHPVSSPRITGTRFPAIARNDRPYGEGKSMVSPHGISHHEPDSNEQSYDQEIPRYRSE